MKKFKIAALSAIVSLGLMPVANVFADTGSITPIVPPPTINIPLTVNTIMNWAFGLIVVVAALMIMYAAVLYLMAGANEEKTKSAKQLIIYAVVAIVVAFVARALVAIVRGLLGA